MMRTRPVALTIVAITAVGAAVRLATLDRQSYWFDELVTVSLLRRGFVDMLRQVPHSEATPYVYYVLAWPWTRLFGDGEVGLRSLSAVAGTAIVPVTYAAGATLVSRRVGVIAAALVAVNPFLVWYAQEARAYSLFALFAALSVLCFAGALRGGRRPLAAWAAVSALAVATHYFAVFLVAAEAVWLLARSRLGRRLVLAAAALPAAVLAAHTPLLLSQRHTGEAVSRTSLTERALGIPKDLVVGYSFPAELAGTVAAAILVSVGVFLVLFATTESRRRGAAVAGGVALASVAVPLALTAVGADYVIARNMIAAVAPAAIFLAAGYAANRLGVAAAALLCCLSLAVVLAVAFDARYGRTDWRGAAHGLGPPTSARAIVVTPIIDREVLRPYLSGLRDPGRGTVRVAEIDVVALATQGGFSTGAVRPPQTPPRAAPQGFRLSSTRRTSTFVLVRYVSRSGGTRVVPVARLGQLDLTDAFPGVFLQTR